MQNNIILEERNKLIIENKKISGNHRYVIRCS